jgi:hypothetical protein
MEESSDESRSRLGLECLKRPLSSLHLPMRSLMALSIIAGQRSEQYPDAQATMFPEPHLA